MSVLLLFNEHKILSSIIHEHFLLNYLQKPIFEKTTFININRQNVCFQSGKTIFLKKIWRIVLFFSFAYEKFKFLEKAFFKHVENKILEVSSSRK